MTLATTVALPAIRHPVVLAKALASLAGLYVPDPSSPASGPGSSRADYAAVGIPFDERWARFDAAVEVLRALFSGDAYDGLGPRSATSHPYPVALRSSGTAAGADRRRACWRSRRPLMGGTPPGTTPIRGTTRTPAAGSMPNSPTPAAIRRASRTRSSRCGSTSATTPGRPPASSSSSRRFSTATHGRWPTNSPSAGPTTASRYWPRTPKRVRDGSCCGRSWTESDSCKPVPNRWRHTSPVISMVPEHRSAYRTRWTRSSVWLKLPPGHLGEGADSPSEWCERPDGGREVVGQGPGRSSCHAERRSEYGVNCDSIWGQWAAVDGTESHGPTRRRESAQGC